MRSRNAYAAMAVIGAAIVAIVSVGTYIYVTSRPARPGAATQQVGAATPPPKPRVADLMARANCTGSVIETQLFAYETGRCNVAAGEVTLAVFDTDALRDQWIAAGRGYGGTFVVGPGWAAGSFSPDAATALAASLGGVVV